MKNLYYDIKAFLILRKEVRKHRNSVDWQRFGLRHDWLYRIYTVMNPTETDKGDDEAMLNMKAMDRLGPINKYIASLGLAEIVSLSMEKIPDTDSYLVVYYQIYRWITPWRLASRLIAVVAGVWLWRSYGEQVFLWVSETFKKLGI